MTLTLTLREQPVVALETEGVDKFKKSWDELVETVRGQMDKAATA